MITGEQIKQARGTETQAQFAARFGVNQSTVHRWEKEGPPLRGPVRIVLEQVLAEPLQETAE